MGNEQPGIGLRETHRIHDEIGAVSNHVRQRGVIPSFRGDKPRSRFRKVPWHLSSVTAGHVHRPPGLDEPPRNGAAEDSSPTKDYRTFHPLTLRRRAGPTRTGSPPAG
jgi:hypothetical protein